MNEHNYAVIMAGGGGTRLWPVSRMNRPKQLLPLLGEETLFQSTVARLIDLFPPERILVVTVEQQAGEMQVQVPEIPAQNYLIEPTPRGTASVVGLAAIVLMKRDPEAAMAILPSDHFIRNRDLFHYLLRAAFDLAGQNYLVTLGITPSYPSTFTPSFRNSSSSLRPSTCRTAPREGSSLPCLKTKSTASRGILLAFSLRLAWSVRVNCGMAVSSLVWPDITCQACRIHQWRRQYSG